METYNKYMSESWNYKKTLDQLISEYSVNINGEDCCLFLTNFKKQIYYYNCYDNFAIGFKNNKKAKLYTILAVKEDGFVYINEYTYLTENSLIYIPVNNAIEIMLQYKDLRNNMCNFENLLNNKLEFTNTNVLIDLKCRTENDINDIFKF